MASKGTRTASKSAKSVSKPVNPASKSQNPASIVKNWNKWSYVIQIIDIKIAKKADISTI